MTQLVTLRAKGRLVIPTEMRESLAIGPGTRIAVTLQGRRIILEPVSEKLVDETRGLLAGGRSLTVELKRYRRRAIR